MVVVSLLVIRNSVEVLRTVGAGNLARARLCSDCFRSTSVGFIAACQILFRTCLEVCFIPACTAKAEARHGQHLLQLGGLTGGTINQRCSADLLNGFQLMTTGSSSFRTIETVRLGMARIVLTVFIDGNCYFFY